jgi:diguanylate cyclase
VERRLVPVLRGVLVTLAAAFVVAHLAAIDEDVPRWLMAVLTNGVYVTSTALVLLRAALVRTGRTPWVLIGLGLTCYTAGTAYSWYYAWHVSPSLPFPSLSDAAWLGFYPLAYAGMSIVVRSQVSNRSALFDSLICGLGAAAVFAAIMVDHVVTTDRADGLHLYVILAYPAGDMALVGLLLARLSLGRLLSARTMMFLGGFLSFVVADSLYVTQNATGDYVPGSLTDLLYLLGLTLIGLASWQRDPTGTPATTSVRLGWSVWFAIAALVVLVAGTRNHMSNLTVALAGSTLLVVVLRVVLSFRELEQLGRARHAEARRDPLTGLANRRAVLEHLDRLPPGPVALLLLDLDRFKEVNDTYGHQAGDRLLELAAERLTRITRAGDLLARLGGDEFVLVLAGPRLAEPATVRTALRIREELCHPFDLDGADVTIDVSVGISLRTDGDATLLFQQADIAMYHAKRAGGGHALFSRLDSRARLAAPPPTRPTPSGPAASGPAASGVVAPGSVASDPTSSGPTVLDGAGPGSLTPDGLSLGSVSPGGFTSGGAGSGGAGSGGADPGGRRGDADGLPGQAESEQPAKSG